MTRFKVLVLFFMVRSVLCQVYDISHLFAPPPLPAPPALTAPPPLPDYEEDAMLDYGDDDKIAISRVDLKSLYGSLLSKYDNRIRPLYDQKRKVDINTKFVPQNVIAFDTAKQKFSILYYIKVEWKDELIKWNPDDYGGTNFVKIPTSDIWMPNLKIVEEFDGRNYIGNAETDIAKITSDGDAQWVPEGMYSVVCEVDIQYYPYDEQTCSFSYYIANEDNDTVTLNHIEDVPLDEYMENAAWKLVDISREREFKWGTYFINIHFKLERRAHFATFTIVTPLLMLSFLNIGVFMVPNDSGEKSTFAITVFLSYGIFITIVSDTLPHNSLQTSYFVVFIISLLAVSAFSVFYSVLQAKLFATIGGKECKIRLPCGNRKTSNRVDPALDHDVGHGDSAAKNNIMTWGTVLNKIDFFMCVFFFIVVGAATIIFFSIMLNQAARKLV